MASVSPHSFRHILLVRILLLLLPLLGISEWLVLHQARLSLLENAQQQANEIAKSRAVTLELRQRELLDSPEIATHCQPAPNSNTTSALDQCDPQSIIKRSLDNVLTQPFLAAANGSVPVLALLGSRGELLGHSAMASSSPSQTNACLGKPLTPSCELINQLTATDFSPRPLASDHPTRQNPNLIFNGKWIVASHSVRLAPFAPALDEAMPPERAPAIGQLVVAVPTSRILAPLKSLTHWMIGATFGLAGISIAVALYLSRELARPAEQLRDRLLAVQRHLTATELDNLNSFKPQTLEEFHLQTPADSAFKIHEFRQLAGAFNQLINCLNQRSTALAQATQEAHTASQLKSDFLAATSHELRTPLNALIGHIQLIQDGYCDDAEEEAACLRQVHHAALHLLKILNELLDIARIEAGKFEFAHQPVELAQLLAEVLDLERSHLVQKGLTLEERYSSSQAKLNPSTAPQYWVQADRDKLKQVILNVISNAIKFTDQGSININLQPLCQLENSSPLATPASSAPASATSSASTSEPTIVLSVTDTGIGIDQRQRQKLFRPFARANQARKQPYEGSGLGLAISRTLMERMGGSIRLYSPGLGQGTTVELHLPLYSSSSSTPTQQPNSEARSSANSANPIPPLTNA